MTGRFKEYQNPNGGVYRFDRYLFRAVAAIVALSALAFVIIYGSQDHVYIFCPKTIQGYCVNPFYSPECVTPDCAFLYMQPGETYGTPPPFFYGVFALLMGVVLATAFLLNHFIYNKRYAR